MHCLYVCLYGYIYLGNESGYGSVHDDMAKYIRGKDPSRVLMYEPASYGPRTATHLTGAAEGASASSDVPLATDILCPMYARIHDLAELGNLFPNMPIIQVFFIDAHLAN